jgi:hypothetical protein
MLYVQLLGEKIPQTVPGSHAEFAASSPHLHAGTPPQEASRLSAQSKLCPQQGLAGIDQVVSQDGKHEESKVAKLFSLVANVEGSCRV